MRKTLNKFKRLFFLMMTILLIASSLLFIFSACKSDYEKAISEGTTTFQETAENAGEDLTPETSAEEAATSTTDKDADNSTDDTATETTSETTDQEQQQVLVVIATSGGYYPQRIDAKAGQPTVLVMQSQDAYGCERAFQIPQLKVALILPENGNTAFDLGVQEKGARLVGVCSMGMYYFQIFFN